jgi:hypothetical protein
MIFYICEMTNIRYLNSELFVDLSLILSLIKYEQSIVFLIMLITCTLIGKRIVNFLKFNDTKVFYNGVIFTQTF